MGIDVESAEPSSVSHEQLRLALKTAASALKDSGIGFALAGGYALWVHGAPEPDHDVDIVVAEDEVEAAADCLRQAGFDIERPPEDWLFKAYSGGAMVDILHRLNATPVDAELISGAEPQEVLGLHIPVLASGRVITSRLLAMTERYCDFGSLLPAVRAVREQVDWTEIESQTKDNEFAAAFLFLARRLGIVETVTGSA